MKVCVAILLAGLAFLGACASQPEQTSTYLLRPQSTSHQDFTEPAIALGKVEVAPYLDHEGIVLETTPGEIHTAQHHRWAEPLNFAIRRYLQVALGRETGHSVAGSLAGTGGVEAKIDVIVHQLHGSVSGHVKLVAEWRIHDLRTGDVLAHRQFSADETIRGDGYAEITRTHAALLDELARSIAGEFRQAD